MTVKRSIYLINPKYQLKFSLFVSTLVLIPSILFPITIYQLVQNIALKVNVKEVTLALEEHQAKLIIFLVLWHLGFAAMVFIICIFQSHKIAGPIYKLQKYLKDIRNNKPAGHLFFRKGDNFHELADDFNDAFNTIQQNHIDDFKSIKNIEQELEAINQELPEDKQNELTVIIQKLSDIQQRYKAD